MSIPLTTLCLNISGLSQPQKHILTILCFRANQHNESYSSIERLSHECSCSIKTVERALKQLRDMNYLIYTGKIAPKSTRIPIYRIDLNHGLSGGDKILITDSVSFDHGLSVLLNTDSEGIRIDNVDKDNRKDIDSPFSEEQLQRWKKEREERKRKLA
jgi:hypothetical protein